jgi:hypothetical protein
MLGYFAGAVIRRMRGQKQKTLVGYLYGHVAKEGETPTHIIDGVGYVGAALPKLPEWDKEKYPYALIRDASSQAHLYCFSDFYCGDNNYTPTDPKRLYVSSDYFSCRAPHDDTSWTDPIYGESGGPSWDLPHITWTNFDVLNEDGTVFLAASDPIPVYE